MEKLKEMPIDILNEKELELARRSILFYSAFVSRGLYAIPSCLEDAFKKLGGKKFGDKKRKVEDLAVITNSEFLEAGDLKQLERIERGES